VRKNAEVGECSFLASIAKGGWAKRRRPKQAPGRESHPRSGSEGPGSRQTNQGRRIGAFPCGTPAHRRCTSQPYPLWIIP